MRLNDPLATSIFFNGVKYPIDLSFNRVIDVFEVFERKDILTAQKVFVANKILIGPNELPFVEQVELWNQIRDDHIKVDKAQKVMLDRKGNPMPMPKEENEKVMDIVEDAKYIYASFRQLGINLFREQNNMQWIEFQAILEALPEDTIMQKIIQIRRWKPSKGESAKYKESMRKAQVRYRLEGGEDDE